MGKEYAEALRKNVCLGIPYKSIDVPFSEREFVRRRRIFFEKLDAIKREHARRYAELTEYVNLDREKFENWRKNRT